MSKNATHTQLATNHPTPLHSFYGGSERDRGKEKKSAAAGMSHCRCHSPTSPSHLQAGRHVPFSVPGREHFGDRWFEDVICTHGWLLMRGEQMVEGFQGSERILSEVPLLFIYEIMNDARIRRAWGLRT